MNRDFLTTSIIKNFICLFLVLSIISCGNDDDSNFDPSLLIENFIEPSTEFGITQDEFRAQLTEQPDRDLPGQITLLDPQNGVYQINYVFLSEGVYEAGNPVFYYFFNVIFYEYQHNFDYMSNYLTNKYGTADEVRTLAAENSISYEWYEDDFDIYLVIDVDGLDTSSNPPGLLLTFIRRIVD